MVVPCMVCGQEATLRCQGCAKVLYCGEDHRKKHASDHKKDCKPFTLERNDKYGRYLVTSREVREGELLLRERPLVVGPRVDSLPACVECLSLLPQPACCAACRVAPLCSRCEHDPLDCGFYRGLTPEQHAAILRASCHHVLPLKILLRLREGLPRFSEVLDMEGHLEARRDTDVWISHHKNVVQLLQTCGVISKSSEDVDKVQQICGVLDVNSFEVRGAMGLSGRGMRLRGVYLEAALMAHDCLANVHLSVDDHFVMTIRAAVDIPAGQPILYNYTDPLQPTAERQRHLREGKYFSCRCRRCEDPTELGTYLGAVVCPRCHKGRLLAAVTSTVYTCDGCGHKVGTGVVTVATMVARSHLDDVDRTDPEQLEVKMAEFSESFAPTHSLLVDLRQSLVAAYRDLEPSAESLARRVVLCKELLPVLRSIEPGISRLRGITLYELHIALVMLGQETADVALLKEAEDVLKEAVSLLVYEPSASPEGELARQAMMELKSLKQMIAKQEHKDDKKKKKSKHKK